eukprot:300923-Pelagomonas_calceolata.AAC.2
MHAAGPGLHVLFFFSLPWNNHSDGSPACSPPSPRMQMLPPLELLAEAHPCWCEAGPEGELRCPLDEEALAERELKGLLLESCLSFLGAAAMLLEGPQPGRVSRDLLFEGSLCCLGTVLKRAGMLM